MIEMPTATIETRTFVRVYDGDADDPDGLGGERRAHRRTLDNLLGGLHGAGDPAVVDERTRARCAAKREDQPVDGHRLAWDIGLYITARLTGGEWLDADFLNIAIAWINSVADGYAEQTVEWWAEQGVIPEHARLLADNSAANSLRAREAATYVYDLRDAAVGS